MAVRGILKDRISATAIAVLVAYVLLLQAIFGGLSQGAMAASSTDPLQVICSSTGVADESNGSAKKAVDCPCGALCRLASIGTPNLVVAPGLLIHRAEIVSVRFLPVAETVSVLPLRGLIPQPRAPPLLS